MPGIILEGGTFRPIFSAGVMDALSDASFCHMHGPEHHVMVGAALLTAYKNAGGAINLRESVMVFPIYPNKRKEI